MIGVQTIHVAQAEGETASLVNETVTSFDAALSLLCRIASRGPDLGYYKTDVLVTWADGRSLMLRHDVMRAGTDRNDVDVSGHLKRWTAYVAKYAARYYIDDETQALAREIADGVRASS